MPLLASMFLPFLACIGLAAVTAALWWRTLQSPWVYLVLSVLALLGLHRVIQAAAELVKLLGFGGGYFLEARQNPAKFVELAQEAINAEAIVVTLVVLAVGLPLVRMLWSLLPKV